jgi:predicted nucleic-acid-binding Zn-ribbon protein
MTSINGQTLRCPHCQGTEFTRRHAQLNTAFLTFLDLDWLNQSADIFACDQCGRLEWYLNPTVTQEDDKSNPITCVDCKMEIPPGEDTCSKCGWTYKT